jgi:hypothetical protein
VPKSAMFLTTPLRTLADFEFGHQVLADRSARSFSIRERRD